MTTCLFLGRKHAELLIEAQKALSNNGCCDLDEIVFAANASIGFNIVSNSLNLLKDEEVFSTNLEYSAMDRM